MALTSGRSELGQAPLPDAVRDVRVANVVQMYCVLHQTVERFFAGGCHRASMVRVLLAALEVQRDVLVLCVPELRANRVGMP